MIKSNKEVVYSVANNMISTASQIEIDSVTVASGTDAEVHRECVESYNQVKTLLRDLNDVTSRDAKWMKFIADNFDMKDNELANKVANELSSGEYVLED